MDKKTLRILNCVFDEKFIDDLIEVMDFTSTNNIINEYACITDILPTYKYVKQCDRIQHINERNFISFVIKKEYNVILLHNLNSIPINVLRKLPKTIKVVWIAWGTDIYNSPIKEHPFIRLDLYKEQTRKVIAPNFIDWLRQKHGYIHYLLHRNEIREAIERVEFFSGVIPSEYIMMSQHPWFKAKEISFNYFKLNDFVQPENKYTESYVGNNILIGNSGDPTNNHLDVFEILKEHDIGNRKIYVSLSYGGSKCYRDVVKDVGTRIFGSNFIVLDTFMPYEEYCKIIASCGYVIMFHERQQGMGNILAALWNGCNLYLSETSEVYKMYKNYGVHVFSIQKDLVCTGCECPLTYDEVIDNREQLIKKRSPKFFLENIYKMYAIIQNDIYGN